MCKIIGCENKGRLRKGMCDTHYRRSLKYGDPQAPRKNFTRRKPAHEKIAELMLTPSDHTECILWPMAINQKGYGLINAENTTYPAHAYLLNKKEPKPSPKHEAAHSCHQRACVNLNHLRWVTSVENTEDKKKNGTYSNRGWHGGLPPGPERDARRKKAYG